MRAVFKLIYLVYRVLSGVRHGAQRRFTAAGLGLLVAFAATGLLGADADSFVGYQAFALLAGLLCVSLVFALRFGAKFGVSRKLPRFGTVGEPLRYVTRVRNLSRKTQRGLSLWEELADPRPTFSEWLEALAAEQRQHRTFRVSSAPKRRSSFRQADLSEASVPELPPNQEAAVWEELTPLRRGLLRLEGVRLARPDPLGLVRAFAEVPAAQNVLVLPKRYALPPIATPGSMKYQKGGVALASSVGESEEFVALRDYRHGDPMRHIHWRSWAKTGKPVVKEFEDEFFVRHALVLDTFCEHPFSEDFEEAVSVAASFACTIGTQESLLDLLFVGQESYCFTAGRGLGQAERMLEILASVRPCGDKPFQTLEHLVLEHAQVVSGCVCVLLAWDEPRQGFVKKLLALGIPVLVLVIVAPGESTKLEPGPMRESPDRFHVLEAGRIQEGLVGMR